MMANENQIRGYNVVWVWEWENPEFSGVLRPGSLTKIVSWVLNGNASPNYFLIQHLDITLCRESAKMIKFWLC